MKRIESKKSKKSPATPALSARIHAARVRLLEAANELQGFSNELEGAEAGFTSGADVFEAATALLNTIRPALDEAYAEALAEEIRTKRYSRSSVRLALVA